jgi:hypothetical protein
MLDRVLNRLYGIEEFAAAFRSVVLVCGVRHSGTTIITQILSTSDDVYSTYVEDLLFLNWRPFRSRKNLAAFLSGARQSGKPIALTKKPRTIEALPTALAILPVLRVVIPVRDGRDAVASNVVRGYTFDAAFKRWMIFSEMIRQWADDERVLVYNHEGLVARPKETLARICRHIRLDYTDELLEYHKKPRNWFEQTEIRKGTGTTKEEHIALRNWQVNQPLFSSAGKWKTVLTEEQVSLFESGEASMLMRAFGYGSGS